jgi:hypothetical protein
MIIEFRAHQSSETDINSSRGKHRAVGQQRRRMLVASGIEIAGSRPTPTRRIIQFRAGITAAKIDSPCDKHHAVG